ncbi:hypothetical protein CLF_109057 [Clonorchis sinensis]|uniref:Uncharacterized protein n=1 Tax=Clonorchis sinensis TaxID=79923 RepID=G7YIW2_CLOSI|nr:hypothetical protein CLF_109057 [Clonorchis sinensis]
MDRHIPPRNLAWIDVGRKHASISDGKMQNLCKSSTLRSFFGLFVPIILTISAVLSLALLFLGIFYDQRTFLTGGVILGLATFGAMLHGCLSHRSLPSSPIVLSAAYMCPVGNMTLATNPNVAAAAMATATLLPRTFKRASFLMNSALETSLLNQPQHWDHYISLPPEASHRSQKVESIPFSYDRQVTDSFVYGSKSLHHGLRDSYLPPRLVYKSQHSCPTRLPHNKPGEHLYVNDSNFTGFTGVEESQPSLKSSQFIGENGDVEQTEPYLTSGTDKLPQSVGLSECKMEKGALDTGSTSRSAVRGGDVLISSKECDPPKVRVISPQNLGPLREPSSVLRQSNYYTPQDIIRFMSQYEAGNYSCWDGRRHDREREGNFGPRVWRGWRSWIDT